jgi:hypothetical protein
MNDESMDANVVVVPRGIGWRWLLSTAPHAKKGRGGNDTITFISFISS